MWRRPAGTLLFTPPEEARGNIIRGIKNMPGRGIAWRQQIRIPGSTRGVSHTAIDLGDGRVFELTFPRAKITPSAAWDARIVAAYAPDDPFTFPEAEKLRDLAEIMEGRVTYAVGALFDYLIYGYPRKRRKGMYCSEACASLYLAVRSYDFSGMADRPRPYQVDPRTLIQGCRSGPFHLVTREV